MEKSEIDAVSKFFNRRNTGYTTAILRAASSCGGIVVTVNRIHALLLRDRAKEMSLFPCPVIVGLAQLEAELQTFEVVPVVLYDNALLGHVGMVLTYGPHEQGPALDRDHAVTM